MMMRVNRAIQQRVIASCILDSQIESLRAQPGEWWSEVENRPLYSPELRSLPHASMSLTVRKATLPELREVTVQIRWHDPGGPEHKARLVTLMGK